MLLGQLLFRHLDEERCECAYDDNGSRDLEHGRISGYLGFKFYQRNKCLHRLRACRTKDAVLRDLKNIAVDVAVEDRTENRDAECTGNVSHERENSGRFADVI